MYVCIGSGFQEATLVAGGFSGGGMVETRLPALDDDVKQRNECTAVLNVIRCRSYPGCALNAHRLLRRRLVIELGVKLWTSSANFVLPSSSYYAIGQERRLKIEGRHRSFITFVCAGDVSSSLQRAGEGTARVEEVHSVDTLEVKVARRCQPRPGAQSPSKLVALLLRQNILQYASREGSGQLYMQFLVVNSCKLWNILVQRPPKGVLEVVHSCLECRTP